MKKKLALGYAVCSVLAVACSDELSLGSGEDLQAARVGAPSASTRPPIPDGGVRADAASSSDAGPALSDASSVGSKAFPPGKNGAPVTLRVKGASRGASKSYLLGSGYPLGTTRDLLEFEQECTATLRIDPGVALHFDNLTCKVLKDDGRNAPGKAISCDQECGNYQGTSPLAGPFCADPAASRCAGEVALGDPKAAGCWPSYAGPKGDPTTWPFVGGGYRPYQFSSATADFFPTRATATVDAPTGGAMNISGTIACSASTCIASAPYTVPARAETPLTATAGNIQSVESGGVSRRSSCSRRSLKIF